MVEGITKLGLSSIPLIEKVQQFLHFQVNTDEVRVDFSTRRREQRCSCVIEDRWYPWERSPAEIIRPRVTVSASQSAMPKQGDLLIYTDEYSIFNELQIPKQTQLDRAYILIEIFFSDLCLIALNIARLVGYEWQFARLLAREE